MAPPTIPLTELAPAVIAVMWIETLLAGITITLRLATRFFVTKAGVGWDDAFMFITFLLFCAYSGSCTAATLWGFGHHMTQLTTEQFTRANLLEVIGQTTLITAIATSKTSVALFLLRIVVKSWHKIVLWSAIASMAIICFFCASLNFFQCKPIAHLWNPYLPAKCWMNVTSLAIATGAYSVVIDFLLAALPWNIVWTLQMRQKEKLNIAISLSLGVFAGVCGIVRTVELQGLSARSDYSYATVPLVLWSATELLITVLCANVAMLRPLYNKLRERSTTEQSGRTPDPYSNPPTIGSTRQPHRGKHSRNLEWSELEDVTVVGALRPKDESATKTTVMAASDDRNRSSESILREARGANIHVSRDIRVNNAPRNGMRFE